MNEARDQAILQAYREATELVTDIASRHRITQQHLYAILEKYGEPRRAERGIRLQNGPPSVRPVLSPMHAAVGDLIHTRRRRLFGPVSDFSKKVGLTQMTLRRIEAGTYDWSLSQMMTICELLDVGVEQVIQTAVPNLRRFQNAA